MLNLLREKFLRVLDSCTFRRVRVSLRSPRDQVSQPWLDAPTDSVSNTGDEHRGDLTIASERAWKQIPPEEDNWFEGLGKQTGAGGRFQLG